MRCIIFFLFSKGVCEVYRMLDQVILYQFILILIKAEVFDLEIFWHVESIACQDLSFLFLFLKFHVVKCYFSITYKAHHK